MTFLEFQNKFPTKTSVIEYFIKIRYQSQVNCNHCGSDKVSHRVDQPRLFQCNNCNNSFSIFKNTVLQDSKIDLRKWMYAIHLFLNGKKGISGCQLQREIKGSYQTSWRLLKQVRIAMGNTKNKELFSTILEIDETYVGGKPRKNNDKSLNDNKRGRGTKKTPIIGIVERTSKKVYAKVSLPNKKGQKLTGKQLLDILNEVAKKDSIVISDEFRGYKAIDKSEKFLHLVIDHSKSFVDGLIHTNNIESFWATLKRGVYGIYHHVSAKYLQNYVNEFCFRYNNRENESIFDLVLRQAII